MTSDQTHLAAQRLRLGIIAVGFWVVASVSGLIWLDWHPQAALSVSEIGLSIGALLIGQTLFDFVGGWLLMPLPRLKLRQALLRWLLGVVGHTLVWMAILSLHLIAFSSFGGFCVSILVASSGLVFWRRWFLQLLTGVRFKKANVGSLSVLTVETGDPGFTGGLVGLGKRCRPLFPQEWLNRLAPQELAVEGERRQWQLLNRLPRRLFLSLLCWNLSGGSVGSYFLSWAERPMLNALACLVCWMTLWSFLGLLILPMLGHGTVYAADRAVQEIGLDPRPWLSRFPELIGEDGSESLGIQSVFYPIPSAKNRLFHLQKTSSRIVVGNLARHGLYYSLATGTLLGRSVHCNLGRPALWIYPPEA